MSALLDALIASNQQDEQSNPFMMGGLGLAKFDTSGYDLNPWQGALVNALKGLGSGISYGYGKAQIDQEQSDRASQLIDAVKNKSGSALVDAIKGVDGMAPYSGAIALDEAEKARASKDAINKQMVDKFGGIIGEDGQFHQFIDPAAQEGKIAGAKKKAELEAEKAAWGNGSNLPPDKIAGIEGDLTKTLTTGSEAQKILETQAKAKQVLEALKSNDPLAATTAIYGFAKTLDPQGTVRDSDARMVADPGGPLGYLAQLHNEILQRGMLTPQAKESMAALIPKILEAQYGTYKTAADTMIGAALKQGASKDKIGVLPSWMPEAQAPQQAQNPLGANAPSLAEIQAELARRRNGKQFYQIR